MNQNNEPSKIVFEGEEFQQTAHSFQTSTPKIIQWVIKYSGGLIKDERQANYVLIGFVAVAIIVVFIFLFSGGSKAKFEAPLGQKIIYPENAPPRLEKKF
ncbi:hypothetical protein KJ973_00270 [Patescibacteria group bacterium]|nr:hypothetical protein [Patescibacteria group bacterium]MBU1519121.1 hypothetical protein [Patescibacteria group bacterium]MBU2416843.1 hypothetical protein [Patescibacteria group bacterium]